MIRIDLLSSRYLELSFASEVPGVRNKTALGLLSSRYLELSFASEVPVIENNYFNARLKG